MKTNKDVYDFSQKSKYGLIGYECFQNKDTKLYYFHFNDKQGKALLYSQGYKTMNSRDNGIKSLSLNRKDSNQYKMCENDGNHYFTIIAKNNQEIGRSRNFRDKDIMVEEMQYLKAFNYDNLENPNINASELLEDKVSFVKNTFRLDVYQISEANQLIGRIEHVLSQKKKKFKKINDLEISEFIKECFDSDSIHVAKEIIKVEEEENELNRIDKKENNISDIEILEADKFWSNVTVDTINIKIINSANQTEEHKPVVIQLNNLNTSTNQQQYYSASIVIASIDKSIENQNLHFANSVPVDGNLEFDIPIHSLPKGLYRLNAELKLADDFEQFNQEAITIKGSQLFQVST